LTGISSVEVNAFQHCADVAIQKSIREGFGLVVSETLWKETPIVAGRTGGIVVQIPESANMLLVDPLDEPGIIERVRHLLHHRDEARRLARKGKEHVRRRFLITRMLEDELAFLCELLGL
ncbi:MAG: glycosyl transferase family 1, partial [Chloroflexota bacterium]